VKKDSAPGLFPLSLLLWPLRLCASARILWSFRRRRGGRHRCGVKRRLELRDGRDVLLFAPVGTPAEYLGNNEVEVQVDGRRFAMRYTRAGAVSAWRATWASFLIEGLRTSRSPIDTGCRAPSC
jgi:hypothetical protein